MIKNFKQMKGYIIYMGAMICSMFLVLSLKVLDVQSQEDYSKTEIDRKVEVFLEDYKN